MTAVIIKGVFTKRERVELFSTEVIEMNIYAISDLHLSKCNPKPMDIFGNNWINHWERIEASESSSLLQVRML
jgi:hypothetical protein